MSHDLDRRTWRAVSRTVGSYEFFGPVLLIGVPYGLAILVQDVIAPRLAGIGGLVATGAGFAAVAALIGLVLWAFARRGFAREARRDDGVAHALEIVERDLPEVARRLDRSVHRPARPLATKRDRSGGSLDEPARRHLVALRTRAERMRHSVARVVDGSPVVPARTSGARRSQSQGPRPVRVLSPVVLRRA